MFRNQFLLIAGLALLGLVHPAGRSQADAPVDVPTLSVTWLDYLHKRPEHFCVEITTDGQLTSEGAEVFEEMYGYRVDTTTLKIASTASGVAMYTHRVLDNDDNGFSVLGRNSDYEFRIFGDQDECRLDELSISGRNPPLPVLGSLDRYIRQGIDARLEGYHISFSGLLIVHENRFNLAVEDGRTKLRYIPNGPIDAKGLGRLQQVQLMEIELEPTSPWLPKACRYRIVSQSPPDRGKVMEHRLTWTSDADETHRSLEMSRPDGPVLYRETRLSNYEDPDDSEISKMIHLSHFGLAEPDAP